MFNLLYPVLVSDSHLILVKTVYLLYINRIDTNEQKTRTFQLKFPPPAISHLILAFG